MLWQPSIPERYSRLSGEELAAGIAARRRELGTRLLILGHHYQQDDVIQHADLTGDSLKLSQMAATECAARGTEFIVFCGVHFMAETADLLTAESVQVLLPDLSAGCSMADMAAHDDAVAAWETIHDTLGPGWSALGDGARGRVIPITYVNSSAAIKAFVGAHGGACCTSSNAGQIFDWALAGGTRPRREDEQIRILFLPDQHLGRNTASAKGFLTEVDEAAGRGKAQTALYNPRRPGGGLTAAALRSAQVLLWAGHCSVHKLFRPEHVDEARAGAAAAGGITVLVHPECCKEVVDKADQSGSTEYIIRAIESAPPGSRWAVGTEVHLVNRLARAAAERGVHVRMLSECQCLCTTMYRIDPPHLLWVLDHLVKGRVLNRIQVPPEIASEARTALDRMLANVASTPVAVKGGQTMALVD
jgi:quinolinate synthase